MGDTSLEAYNAMTLVINGKETRQRGSGLLKRMIENLKMVTGYIPRHYCERAVPLPRFRRNEDEDDARQGDGWLVVASVIVWLFNPSTCMCWADILKASVTAVNSYLYTRLEMEWGRDDAHAFR